MEGRNGWIWTMSSYLCEFHEIQWYLLSNTVFQNSRVKLILIRVGWWNGHTTLPFAFKGVGLMETSVYEYELMMSSLLKIFKSNQT